MTDRGVAGAIRALRVPQKHLALRLHDTRPGSRDVIATTMRGGNPRNASVMTVMSEM